MTQQPGDGPAATEPSRREHQPQGEPGAPPEPGRGDSERRRRGGRPENEEPPTAESLKAFLEARMAESKRRIGVYEDSIKRLESGETAETVRQSLRDRLWPGDRGERGGGGGRGGGEGERGGPDERSGPNGITVDGRWMRPARPLTAEERQQIRAFIESTFPEALPKLDEYAKAQPEQAEQRLAEWAPRIRGLIDMKERDPEMYSLRLRELELGFRAMPLSRAVLAARAAGDEAAAQRELTALRAVAGEMVDARMAVRREELDRFQARLDRLRAEIQQQSEQRDRAVAEQTEQILQRDQDRPAGEKPRESGGGTGGGGPATPR